MQQTKQVLLPDVNTDGEQRANTDRPVLQALTSNSQLRSWSMNELVEIVEVTPSLTNKRFKQI